MTELCTELPADLADSLVVRVSDPVLVEYDDGIPAVPVSRPCLVIAAALEGSLEIEGERRTATVTPGSVGVTRPKERATLRLRAKPGQSASYLWAPVTAHVWGGVDLFALIDPPASLNGSDASRMTTSFDKMLEPDTAPHALARTLRRAVISGEILALVAERSTTRPGSARLLARAAQLAPVLRGMAASLGAPHDIPSLAEMGHLSPASLHRRFTAIFGTSPMAYLKNLRLDESAQRLFRTDDAVAEIAHSVGFTNAFHFSREFRARFGTPPTRYRAASRDAVSEKDAAPSQSRKS